PPFITPGLNAAFQDGDVRTAHATEPDARQIRLRLCGADQYDGRTLQGDEVIHALDRLPSGQSDASCYMAVLVVLDGTHIKNIPIAIRLMKQTVQGLAPHPFHAFAIRQFPGALLPERSAVL